MSLLERSRKVLQRRTVAWMPMLLFIGSCIDEPNIGHRELKLSDGTGASTCGNGVINGTEACDGHPPSSPEGNIGFVFPSGTSCKSLGFSGGFLRCLPNCTIDTSGCTSCGNGMVEGNEQCDKNDFVYGKSCKSYQGLGSGQVGCGTSCTVTVATCSNCGNNYVQPGEQCDGTLLAGKTCSSIGYAGGTLTCTSTCTFDTSKCSSTCGNKVLDSSEACDGKALGTSTCATYGFTDGDLDCTTACAHDTQKCFYNDWVKAPDATASQSITSVINDASGNAVIGGTFTGTLKLGSTTLTTSTQKVYIATVNSTGQFLSASIVGNPSSVQTMDSDASGNLYLAGPFSGTATFGSVSLTAVSGVNNLYVVKLSSTGVLAWAAQASGKDLSLRGLSVGPNGAVVMGGTFRGSATLGSKTLTARGGTNDLDIWIASLSQTGAFQWTTSGGSVHTGDNLGGLDVDPNNAIVMAGVFGHFAKFGSSTLAHLGTSDLFLIKLSSTGTVLWAKTITGTLSDVNYLGNSAKAVKTDASGNIYLGGLVSGIVDPDTTIIKDTGKSNVFVIKLDGNGTILWGNTAGGPYACCLITSEAAMGALMVDASGVYVTGSFSDRLLLDNITLINGGDTYGGYSKQELFAGRLDAKTGAWMRALSMPITDCSSGGAALASDGKGKVFVLGSGSCNDDGSGAPEVLVFGKYTTTLAGGSFLWRVGL